MTNETSEFFLTVQDFASILSDASETNAAVGRSPLRKRFHPTHQSLISMGSLAKVQLG
jgi:hypothetical protein